MDKDTFETHIKTVLTVITTSILLWIGVTVQNASQSIAVLQNDVTTLKTSLENTNQIHILVIEQAQEIKSLNYRLTQIEKLKNENN